MTPDLFSAPPRAVRETSIAAMRSVEPRAPNLRTRIWRELNAQGPMTPDETADALGESILSVRPQFTLLTKENKIADTGTKRKNASQRDAIVWEALPPSVWREQPEHMTAQERIAALEARVHELEAILEQHGIYA